MLSSSADMFSPLFQFQAHNETTSSIAFSQRVPGLMATSSIDKTVKIWDTGASGGSASSLPRQVAYKTMSVGKLFALQFSHDDPFLLAAGGDKGMLAIWDCDEQELISMHFQDRPLSKSISKYNSTSETDMPFSDTRVEGVMTLQSNSEINDMDIEMDTESHQTKSKKKKSKNKNVV
jgi:WD40 repeat protein